MGKSLIDCVASWSFVIISNTFCRYMASFREKAMFIDKKLILIA